MVYIEATRGASRTADHVFSLDGNSSLLLHRTSSSSGPPPCLEFSIIKRLAGPVMVSNTLCPAAHILDCQFTEGLSFFLFFFLFFFFFHAFFFFCFSKYPTKTDCIPKRAFTFKAKAFLKPLGALPKGGSLKKILPCRRGGDVRAGGSGVC